MLQGAEYDVMPCLAEFKDAELIDEIFLEEHWWFPDRTAEQSFGRKRTAARSLLFVFRG